MTVNDNLRRFARRLEGGPDFLAHALWRYRQEAGDSREDLRERLGLDRDDEATEISMACCRLPDTPDEISRVAAYRGADAAALAAILAEVGDGAAGGYPPRTVVPEKTSPPISWGKQHPSRRLRGRWRATQPARRTAPPHGPPPRRVEAARGSMGHRADPHTRPLRVYADGLCEPNPGGIGTFGFIVLDPAGREVRAGKGLAARGREEGATNNQAEYTAAIRALRWLLEGGHARAPVVLHSDSRLLVNQLSGAWQVKSPAIRPLWEEARGLLARFTGGADALWVPREGNERADALSVEAYVEVLEAERASRSGDVTLQDLGKGLFRANGRYLTDALFGTCDCPDFRRLNAGRFTVRCKHLFAAERVWPHALRPHPPLSRPA